MPSFPDCPNANIDYMGKNRYTFSDPGSFTFQQKSDHLVQSIKVVGDVVVESVDYGDEIVVDFSLKLSHDELQDMISIEAHKDGIVLKTKPGSLPRLYPGSYCLGVNAKISIPLRKDVLGHLEVAVEALNINLDPSLDLQTHMVRLAAISGNVKADQAYGVDSKKTIISVDSGCISGDFGLNDLVQLETQSGNIRANVIPQDSHSKVAEYRASTVSGLISSHFPETTDGLPADRTYKSEVHTTSGSIRGVYLLGHTLSLSTISGSISDIRILATNSEYSLLATDSKQGSTTLRFINSLGKGKLGLTGRHSTVSGSLNVVYPRDYEGTLEGSTVAGSVNIGGEGVTITENTRWPGRNIVKGAKGAGKNGQGGSVEANTINGSVRLWVG